MIAALIAAFSAQLQWPDVLEWLPVRIGSGAVVPELAQPEPADSPATAERSEQLAMPIMVRDRAWHKFDFIRLPGWPHGRPQATAGSKLAPEQSTITRRPFLAGGCLLLSLASCSEFDEGSFDFVFTPHYTVQLADAPADVHGGGVVALRDDAAYLAITASSVRATEIYIFGVDGSFHTTLGSAGQGPREYQWISAMGFDHADSLWVFDYENQRLDVYDPELSFARSTGFDGRARSVVAQPGGGVLVASVFYESGQTTIRVERIKDQSREVIVEETQGDDPLDQFLVAASDDAVYVARQRVYSLRRLGWDDRALTVLAEDAPEWWISPTTPEKQTGYVDSDPNPFSLMLRSADELWLLGAVIRPPRDALSMFEDPERPPQDIATEVNQWIHNTVQILDATTGVVRTESHFIGQPVYFLDERRGYRWEPAGADDIVSRHLVIGEYGNR